MCVERLYPFSLLHFLLKLWCLLKLNLLFVSIGEDSNCISLVISTFIASFAKRALLAFLDIKKVAYLSILIRAFRLSVGIIRSWTFLAIILIIGQFACWAHICICIFVVMES